MKNRKRFLLLLLFTFLLSVLSACSKEIAKKPLEVYSYENIEDKIVIENDKYKFCFFPETTHFNIENKSTRQIWYSNPQNTGEQGGLTDELESTLTIRYNTESGSKTMMSNYGYSIKKSNYTYEVLDNGIKVNYTIGNVNKIYYVPRAVPESRFLEFFNRMSKSVQNQIHMSYRIYDINDLRKNDDKDKLIATYPDIVNEPIYVMMDSTPEYLIKMAEEKFAEVGYGPEDYEIDAARYSSETSQDVPVFNISIIYELKDDGFEVSIPLKQIEYKKEYPIVEVRPLPFFGAGGTVDDGFILVPDGSGGIINFNNQKQSQNSYISNLYGWDYALNRKALIDETRVNMPIFGISRNGASFICVLEEGSSYGFLEADVSGGSNEYNYCCANYNLIHSEVMDISAKSDRTIRMFEEELPDEIIRQKYIFVDDDDYVSMATKYRKYLMDRFPQLTKRTESDFPVAVEIIGAIDRTKHYLGMPTRQPYELTSYKEAENMIKELKEAGFTDLSVKYKGWFNDGVLHKPPNKVKHISELGSKKDLISLAAYASEHKVNLYLSASFQFVYNNSLFDNFISVRDGAKHVNRKVVELVPYNPIYYGKTDYLYTYHLARPSYYLKNLDNYANEIVGLGVKNIALEDIGMILSSDFNRKSLVSREKAMKLQMNKLSQLAGEGYNILIHSGNMYAVPYADMIVDLNLATKGYNIIDEEIPFYEIVLHGLVSYTGSPINLSPNYERNLLKTIETGAGLYFSFMDADIFDLQDSRYTNYFSSDYNQWKEKAAILYNEMKSNFGHLFNQFIIDHQKLASDVYMTEYEDGTRIIVNYGEKSYIHKGTEIPAKDYTVEGGK